MKTRVLDRINLVRVAATLAALVHFGASRANAGLVCIRPNFAPPPQTPAGQAIPSTILFGKPFDGTLTDPSNGDDSFNYFLRIGPGSIKYVWIQGESYANDSCEIALRLTLTESHQASFTQTSSQSIQSSLTSTLTAPEIGSIGSTIGATDSISMSFTQGNNIGVQYDLTIPKCSVVTFWHQYRIADFEFLQGRQVDLVGGWENVVTDGRITFTEYTMTTITTAPGVCVPEPSSLISLAITAGSGALAHCARRKRTGLAS